MTQIYQSLKLSTMVTDTELAQQYIKEHKSEFHSTERFIETGQYGEDAFKNKIFYIDYEKSKDKVGLVFYKKEIVEMYQKLAAKIEVNADLFAQLDYLIRKVPADVTKKCDIKLITNNIMYWSTQYRPEYFMNGCDDPIIMKSDSPLSTLGLLAQNLWMERLCIIEANKDTAAVCHLFTKLCHEVGLSSVYLMLVENISQNDYLRDNSTLDVFTVKGFQNGGMGVITECSDLDSAVQAFISYNFTYPWHLRRLLVQESVYENVKNVFGWKNKVTESKEIMNNIKSKCSEAYQYNDKIFLFDYADSEGPNCSQKYILVEAYRTVKELLSLITKYDPFCMSLWSSDICVANEIVYSVKTNYIWVNDIGVLEGPTKISQGFYTRILNEYPYTTMNRSKDMDNLSTIYAEWLKLDVKSRRKVLMEVVNNYVSVEKDDNSLRFLNEMVRRINWNSNKTIEVENGTICISVDESVGIVAVLPEPEEMFLDTLRSVVFGNGVVALFHNNAYDHCPLTHLVVKLIDELNKKGVPIVITKEEKGDGLKLAKMYVPYKTRVIWMNFGTIFAN